MDWNQHRVHQRLRLDPQTMEEIYALLAEIDGLKNTWALTEAFRPQTLERLMQSVIVTSTGSSNRIEGNLLTDEEVEDLYKNLRIKKFKTRDEQEVAGYLRCLEVVFENYKDISLNETFILKLHQDMLIHSDRDERHRGNYKFGPNRVEAKDATGKVVGIIFDPTPPYLVKKEMHELLDWYTWAVREKQKHPLLLIANFIFEYLAIHPFQDGNGRTSRLLSNLMLLQQGYFFTRFVSHEGAIESNKADYYLSLNKTQNTWKTEKENISPWILFFLKTLQKQCQQAISILKNQTIDHLLSEKQLEVWNWVQKNTGTFSRKDAIEALQFSPRTIESIIKKLLSLKKLQSFGEGRATRYTERKNPEV